MLHVVPTPIGNLGDITVRALEVLRAVDLIAAEDTRHTRRLLTHYGIDRPLASYHEHNERRRAVDIAGRLERGEAVALVTDAGTPTVSDPGFRILEECIARGLAYSVLPGASSVVVAAAACGFGGGRFFFGGFLPVKSGQRRREIGEALRRDEFSLYFESPHRLLKSLAVLAELDRARLLCVCRELSKRHEEIRRGSAPELIERYSAHPPRGEIVLAVAGAGGRRRTAGRATDAAG